jgi:hypothetical protein
MGSNPDDKDRNIEAFFETEGVRLDRTAKQPNEAKRGIARLCLSFMWRKMRERNNRTKSKMISDPQDLYRFLATPGIEVANLLFASDKFVWASCRYMDEDKIPYLRHTKEVIGAFVTSGARLHLNSYLDRLREKALYCDTDSVFYVQRDSEPGLILCGDKRSDMINELKPCERVSEFVSDGPKNYAYKIANYATEETKTACKIRGITLNYSARHLVNF